MTEFLEVGSKAPAFSLLDDAGNRVKLSDLKEQIVVLYFYPRDDTPGCTKEACAFRDCYSELQKLGAVVLGISGDSADSHVKFRDKYSLPFRLLVDQDHAVAEKYGVWREKNMYGKKSMGIQRSTYMIDGRGKVHTVWKRVKVDGHDEQVVKAVRELAAT